MAQTRSTITENIRKNIEARIPPEKMEKISRALEITAREKHDAITIILGTISSGFFSVFAAYFIIGYSGYYDLGPAFLTGILIGGFIFSFETKFMSSPFSFFLRTRGFWLFLLVKIFFYLFAIIFSLNFSRFLFYKEEFILGIFTWKYLSSVTIAISASIAVNLYFTVRPLIGASTIANILKGTYHHPKEEERIFMFLDLASSTTIAESIGNINFHRLLNRFFYDFSEPVLRSRGEIYKYVGDEIIIVWKKRSPRENLRALMLYFQILKKVEDQKEKYMDLFGVVPSFRAGFHFGRVITGEMGDIKKEIVYLGDTVNTASRIQSECKYHNKDVIISEQFLEIMEKPPYLEFPDMGMITLRGKKNPLRLFSVELKE